jgi:DNA-directed RNA polymerase specialized sigma24 family protein
MPLTLPDQPEFLRLIRSRSRTGAEALYDQYAKILGFAIFRIIQQKELTDIILEKTICKIWDSADHYNEQEMPLLTWMLAIAKRLAREHIAVNVEPLAISLK